MSAPSAGKFWVVIPAAGAGSRFGGALPKQYRRLGSCTILERTLSLFTTHPAVRGVALALSPDDPYWPTLAFSDRARVQVVAGGAERSESVLQALRALRDRARSDEYVLVHDAARPCLSQSALARLVESAMAHPVGGLLAVPVADTLKRADAALAVAETVDRSGLWQAQTPQMFRFGLLLEALESALSDPACAARITDEASALELAGHAPLLVAGESTNLKITRTADLDLAARILGVDSA